MQARNKGEKRDAKRKARSHPSSVGDTANEAARNKEKEKQERTRTDTERAEASGKKHRGEQQTRGSHKEKPRRAGGAPNQEAQNNKGRDREHSKNRKPDQRGGAAQGGTTRVRNQATRRSTGRTRERSIPAKRRKEAPTPKAHRPLLSSKRPLRALLIQLGSRRIP